MSRVTGHFTIATVIVGAFGALADATCNPTRTLCPAASGPAQSTPVQVIVLEESAQVMPQELTIEETPGLDHDTVQPDTRADAVTVNSAT